jgi:bacterioferritin-associated ferredoxin
MYLCVCNAVREIEIDRALDAGVANFAEFSKRTGCSGECGTCREDAEALFNEAMKDRRISKLLPVPVLSFA